MNGVSFYPPPSPASRSVFHQLRIFFRKLKSDVKLTVQVVLCRLIWQAQFRDVLISLFWTTLFTAVIINDLVQYLHTRDVSRTSQVVTVPLMYAQTILVYYTMGCYHLRYFCRKHCTVPHMKGFLWGLFYYTALLLVARLAIECVFKDTRPEVYNEDSESAQVGKYAGLGAY
ncbi:hypothetical protein BV898_03227 [Hypsibius exemplaris]|uniref:Uncharacterized protein n=1 Tax=Hypsibius exemplaris TaxID=2072580 RepID=A0A1W0X650_HYPEX|nr:hypothetical protein BV898_03227 [Hypsibius exemplaris]